MFPPPSNLHRLIAALTTAATAAASGEWASLPSSLPSTVVVAPSLIERRRQPTAGTLPPLRPRKMTTTSAADASTSAAFCFHRPQPRRCASLQITGHDAVDGSRRLRRKRRANSRERMSAPLPPSIPMGDSRLCSSRRDPFGSGDLYAGGDEIDAAPPPLKNESCARDDGAGYANSDVSNDASSSGVINSVNGVSEAEILLACRAYLARKGRIEWKEKKRRREAAASASHLEGYFWPDPGELVYLRERADPTRWESKSKEGDSNGDDRANAAEFYKAVLGETDDEEDNIEEEDSSSSIPNEKIITTSYNPFSIHPAFPSEEHVKRSEAKLRLWRDDEWKEQWYERRWKDRVVSPDERRNGKYRKLLEEIPLSVLASDELASLTDDQVAEALRTYKSSSRRKTKTYDRKRNARDEFRARRKEKVDAGLNADGGSDERDRRNATSETATTKLTFEPSLEEMKRLREARAEKSRRAFRTRLTNRNANDGGREKTSSTRVLARGKNGIAAVDSPMQALLRIDLALDHGETPSPIDVQTMLIPGRLGRRRDVLRRILSECFDLRGKCVPPSMKRLSGGGTVASSGTVVVAANEEKEDGEEDDERDDNNTPPSSLHELLFATKCSIDELGTFVLVKLRLKVRSMK